MRLLFILIIFISVEGKAQVWHQKRFINWDHPASAEKPDFYDFISFQGEVQNDPENEFPIYSELLDWNAEYPFGGMSIIYPVYEVFSGEIPDQPISDKLCDSLSYNYSLDYMQKKPFIGLNLTPFRKNAETGKLERLKTFVIRMEASASGVKEATKNKKSAIAENSVLSSGSWYKIKVPSAGIYKLTYDQISTMSVGNPANVRVFGAGGFVLPENFTLGEKDDLSPVQIYMHKGTDGIFNSGDYILFYSQGTVKWDYDLNRSMFRHTLNPYSDFAYYFITSGSAPDLPRVENTPPGPANRNSESYDYYAFHEKESENVLLSGKQWFGEEFSLAQQQSFNFSIPGLIITEPLNVITQVMAKAIDSSFFQLSYNNSLITSFSIQPANLSDYTSTFGFISEKKSVINNPGTESITLKLKYLKPDGSARGWLDYLIINGRANLRMQSDYLAFRDWKVNSPGNITEFSLSSANSNTIVWDVTNQNDIKKINVSLAGTALSFKVATDTLREFVAFNENGSFPSPIIQGNDLGTLANQDLHGDGFPDMVIITYKDFQEQAERLASYRREKGGLEVIVVTPDKIYNEFSSGTPDIGAIRNFMKMLYVHAGSDSSLLPRYLLLFGDGTYDNKGITDGATNYILTYQSDNSLSPTASYVSDDYFGLLDPGENMISGLLDVGIGRLPVGTKEEAELMVNKILDYELPSRMGDWRNTLCFIGDDEDGNIHMSDADGMATNIESKYPGFNINKIYLDAYKQVSTPSGQRYPDVNMAINDQVERGSLILNYTGHGGIKGWAHELILGLNEIESWKNYNRLPLFMTATCEFSRYDDHIIPSAGEKVLLNPNGGSIALLTTTRLVYSQPNRVLNEKFYEIVFEKDKDGKNYRLGDIMQYTKNKASSGINKRNFTLLGDPSLRLSYPEFFVSADSLNGKSILENPDTLQALKEISVSGHISDHNGNILTDFNGYVFPTIYDKVVLQQTLANDGGSKKTFSIRNNILYKGKSTVQNGKFTFSFIVPKDINYAYGTGRLSFYAEDSIVDATGANNDIIIGGTFPEAEKDLDGPELKVYMNSSTFRSGGITDENPMLYVEVSDEHGVNTTGNGIGHNITAMLDDNSQNVFLLNEYYQSYLNSYQGGLIRYPFSNMEPGHHTVSVKVWDIYNNSNSGSTDFVVLKSEDLVLDELLNFPNPFRDYTYFSFGHNSPGVEMDITVDIFDMEGKLVSTIKAKEANSGYRSQNIYWDGTGAENGQSLYIFRIRVKTSDGKSAEKSGKLIITK